MALTTHSHMRKPKKYLVKVEGENRSGSTTMAAVDPIYEGEPTAILMENDNRNVFWVQGLKNKNFRAALLCSPE